MFHESKQFPTVDPVPANILGFQSAFRRSLEEPGLLVQQESFRQDPESYSYRGGFWGVLKLEKPSRHLRTGIITCLVGLLIAITAYILTITIPLILLANPTPSNVMAAAILAIVLEIIFYGGIGLIIVGVVLLILGLFHNRTAIGLAVTLEGFSDVFHIDVGFLIIDYRRTINEKARKRLVRTLSENPEILEQWNLVKNLFAKASLDYQVKMQKSTTITPPTPPLS